MCQGWKSRNSTQTEPCRRNRSIAETAWTIPKRVRNPPDLSFEFDEGPIALLALEVAEGPFAKLPT